MAIYSLANRTTGVTSGTAALEIRTAAGNRPRIMQIDLVLAAATASQYGLGRPQAIGVTPTSPIALLAEESSDPPANAATALAWATGPTAPLLFFRRHAFPATVGSTVSWIFPRGLVIPVSNGLVLWNLATNGVVDVNIVVDE